MISVIAVLAGRASVTLLGGLTITSTTDIIICIVSTIISTSMSLCYFSDLITITSTTDISESHLKQSKQLHVQLTKHRHVVIVWSVGCWSDGKTRTWITREAGKGGWAKWGMATVARRSTDVRNVHSSLWKPSCASSTLSHLIRLRKLAPQFTHIEPAPISHLYLACLFNHQRGRAQLHITSIDCDSHG